MYSADINKIIPFSSVDGPGNRTVIFLQGCNFDCKYCHNPETRNHCINCMECVKPCPAFALKTENNKVVFIPEKCIGCDSCIRICKHGATPRIIRLNSLETFEKISENMPFIRGATFSGGECMLYPDFIREVFTLCKEKSLGTLIDSNGSMDFEDLEDLLKVTDGVMLDIKAFDPLDHINVTAVNNDMVLKNAVFLANRGKLFEVRTVIVPGLFDYKSTVYETSKLLAPFLSISNIRYKIIKYRENGVRREYRSYKTPSENEMEVLEKIARDNGFNDIVII